MKGKNSTITSALIAMLIVLMLMFSGSAQAVQVLLDGIQPQYKQGSFVNFSVSIKISNPDKYVSLKNIGINITGPVSLDGTFYLNGTQISSSSNLKITPIVVPHDENYGYGNKNTILVLKYNVSINTTSLPSGNYTAIAKLISDKANMPSTDSYPIKFELI